MLSCDRGDFRRAAITIAVFACVSISTPRCARSDSILSAEIAENFRVGRVLAETFFGMPESEMIEKLGGSSLDILKNGNPRMSLSGNQFGYIYYARFEHFSGKYRTNCAYLILVVFVKSNDGYVYSHFRNAMGPCL